MNRGRYNAQLLLNRYLLDKVFITGAPRGHNGIPTFAERAEPREREDDSNMFMMKSNTGGSLLSGRGLSSREFSC